MKNEIQLAQCILATVCTVGLMNVPAYGAKPQQTLREQGTIENIDTQAGKLTVKHARTHAAEVFTWNQDTRFLERRHLIGKSKAVQPSDLSDGQRVDIQYEKQGDNLVARKVVVTRSHNAAAHPSGAAQSQS